MRLTSRGGRCSLTHREPIQILLCGLESGMGTFIDFRVSLRRYCCTPMRACVICGTKGWVISIADLYHY
jgi:hypothetical protein